ncbi:MAG: histidinol dehydrogenase [Firmicutes bacterium]|nr:histidinol dehydrogenase [Bacillota bacterium]
MIRVYTNKKSFLAQYKRRTLADHPEALASVREILKAVRERGDAAVFAYTERYDGVALTSLAVTEAEYAAAESLVEQEVADALKEAAENIRSFHARQLRNSWLEYGEDGSLRGQRIIPLEAVGAYVPGGSAAYPSSVLMTVIPARVAGVKRVVLATPPQRDGSVNPYTLLAAKIAGADAVYKCGGAQAIAALAYGTESIPAVDKIVGPGNLFVTLAKREVAGQVGIDMLAGPSEILVVADETARADFVACDLLSQAEHDPLAAAYCVITSATLLAALPAELERQCADLARSAVAKQSLADNGAVVKVESLNEAVEVANLLAPEHLELQVADPWALLAGIRHAGAVFLGAYTPEPVGDYWAGPNHVLPTSGAGRHASVLSVDDFVKRSSVLYYPPAVLLRQAAKIEALAAAEGLTAHGRAVAIRREELERQNS